MHGVEDKPEHKPGEGKDYDMMKECGAEFVGTFMLVTSVVGAALFSAPSAGLIAVALSIGTAVLAMAYAVGHISGGHFNPAVTAGVVAAGPVSAGRAVALVVPPAALGAGGPAGFRF